MADIIKYWTTQVAALVEATGASIIVLAAIELSIRTMKGERDTATMGLSEPSLHCNTRS